MDPRLASFRSCLLVALLPAALAWSLSAARAEIDPVYRALREAEPDGRVIPAEGRVLERDALRFQFSSGQFHLLAPVEGRSFGAVFIGEGSYTLTPATESERRHLALRMKDPELQSLSDSFEELVLFFGSDAVGELAIGGAPVHGEPDDRALGVYREYMRRQRTSFKINVHLKLLQAWMNDGGAGSPFYAFVNGRRVPPALIMVDPLGHLGAEESCFVVDHDMNGGYWYSSHLLEEVRSGAAKSHRPTLSADALHYELETHVARDTDVRGMATIRLKAGIPALRVVTLELLPELRIEGASQLVAGMEDEEIPLTFVQEPEEEEADAAVVLARPLAQGAETTIRLRYAGDEVLENDGDGNFSVSSRARASWYPNVGGFIDRATYDLIYHVPANVQVVAVGRPLDTHQQGNQTVSTWKVDQPVNVAGFNYGKFTLSEEPGKNSDLTLQVYTNPGIPDVIQEINEYLRQSGGAFGTPDAAQAIAGTDFVGYVGYQTGPSSVKISTELLAQRAMADAQNSTQVFTAYFGPLPFERLAITQQSQWFFGQAWPTLIYLPYLAAFDATTRNNLGLERIDDFVEEVAIHEIAHQWWGHLVSWEGYRDQWLSEGFAEFSTALVLQLTRGERAYREFWKRQRDTILETGHGGTLRNYEAGPITLGFRASTSSSPAAYTAMAYKKGAFVLHMLRMMMRDPKSDDPDARFFAMLKDFAQSFAGKNAGTEDFKTVVERHMVPDLNATRDGKIDWFFEQWIHGTELPAYRVEIAIEKAGRDEYRFHGTVSQSGVSEDFLAMLPLYIEYGKDSYGSFGRAPFKGNMTHKVDTTMKLDKKPKSVLANAQFEVLALD